jgi:hypothetical protein
MQMPKMRQHVVPSLASETTVCPACKSPYWEGYAEFVTELHEDSAKAEKVIDQLSDEITNNAEQGNWDRIVREGWQRMIETSELPIAKVEKVFEGGFSIQEWFLSAKIISRGLAASVSSSFISTSKSEVTTNDDIVERAEKVLEWRKILQALDPYTVKVLGLFGLLTGYLLRCCIHKPALLIPERICQLQQKRLAENKRQLLSHVEEVIEKIDSANKTVTSWAEIIRFV